VAPESVPKASNVHEENVVSLGRGKNNPLAGTFLTGSSVLVSLVRK
jgi:hypothetical protein